VLLYGPPGTGKTHHARAVANRTDACFIRVIGSELVQTYVGEGARMVRELFAMARSKKACIVFFDEIDAIGGARGDDASGDNEVQRTMLEIVNQLDGFDARGNIKVRDGCWVVVLGGSGGGSRGGLLGAAIAAFMCFYCFILDRCYSLLINY
jgi:ATP-dependent 26S proteasome regulatory subunit